MSPPANPLCPKCGTNKDVLQLVRVIQDERRRLNEKGEVEDYRMDQYPEETGWGWTCRHCSIDWDRTGSLALESDQTPSPINPHPGEITTHDWDRMLGQIIGDLSAATLMQIPGLYAILSAHFNSDITDLWREEQGAAAEADRDQAFIDKDDNACYRGQG